MEAKFSSLGEQSNYVKDIWVTFSLLLTISGTSFFTYLLSEAAGAAAAAPSSLWGVNVSPRTDTHLDSDEH